VPSVETLEKYARAMEIPLYKLFYEGSEEPKSLKLRVTKSESWGDTGKERDELRKFAKLLSRLDEREREILRKMASEMLRKKTARSRKRAAA